VEGHSAGFFVFVPVQDRAEIFLLALKGHRASDVPADTQGSETT
jgi:hypothetical protein